MIIEGRGIVGMRGGSSLENTPEKLFKQFRVKNLGYLL
jgi:hypothetical protein